MRKTNTRKKEQAAVVPIASAGVYRPPARVKCLTFARTHEIALRVSDARETELRHIRRCNSCAARFRAFQRDLGTDAHHSVFQHIDHVVFIGLDGTGKSDFASIVKMFAINIYNSFYLPEEPHDDDGPRWHQTHVLAHMVNHVFTLAHEVVDVFFKAAETALVHAASTYVFSESMDDAWLLLEGMKEGAIAATQKPHVATRYARLYAHVAAEGPPLIRHVLLLGISELNDRGGEAHHFARMALDELYETRHAADIATACILITRDAHKAVFISALEVERLHERIARMTQSMRAELAGHGHGENVDATLWHGFEDPTPRSQVIGLLTAKRALHDAFEYAHAHKVDKDHVREFLSRLIRARMKHVLITSTVAATAAARYLEAYVEMMLMMIRPHDVVPLGLLSAHDRHGLVLSVLQEYERGGLVPPRFEREGHAWTVAGDVGKAIDAFSRELAALANEHPNYAFHLEWANAHFGNTAHNTHSVREEYAAR
jgi:hypothetical protein